MTPATHIPLHLAPGQSANVCVECGHSAGEHWALWDLDKPLEFPKGCNADVRGVPCVCGGFVADRRPSTADDPCTCGHPRSSHRVWWHSGMMMNVYGCDAAPGQTCACKGFVLDTRLRMGEHHVEGFDDYQSRTEATVAYPSEVALSYLALGLASEAGELAGLVKKVLRGDEGQNLLAAKHLNAVRSELGDVLWYAARLAALYGLRLSDVAQENLTKLADRKDRGVVKGSGDTR